MTHWHHHPSGLLLPARMAKAAAPRRSAEWRRLRALADRVEPRFRRSFIQAINRIKDRATINRLASVLEMGRQDEVLRTIGIGPKDFKELTAQVEDTFRRAGEVASASLQMKNQEIEGRFDLLNPKTVDHLRTYRFQLITQVTDETRRAIGRVVLDAFENGGHPREQARRIRDLIGLTDRQARAVENYRSALEEEGRDPAQVERMVSAYARRALTARAYNIARTETIRASDEGQRALWQQMADEGILREKDARREWVITPDDRLCPICEAIPEMNPNGVGMNEPFQTPNGPMMGPPAHPQCRCAQVLSFED